MGKYQISIPYGIIVAKSYRGLLAQVEQEDKFWTQFELRQGSDFSTEYESHRWAHGHANYCTQMFNFWGEVIDQLKALDGRSFASEFPHIKQAIENSEIIPPHSRSTLAGAISRDWVSGDRIVSKALLYAIATKQSDELSRRKVNEHQERAFRSMADALLYSTVQMGEILEVPTKAALRDESIAERVAEDLGLMWDRLNAEQARKSQEAEALESKLEKRIKTLHSKQVSIIRKLVASERAAAEERSLAEAEALEAREEKFQKLKELYEAHLGLKHPAQMWEERRKSHQKQSDTHGGDLKLVRLYLVYWLPRLCSSEGIGSLKALFGRIVVA